MVVIQYFKKMLIFFFILSIQGCDGSMWNYEREFSNNINELDGGLLNVFDDRVYFLLNRKENLRFKRVYSEDGRYLTSEFSEEWMNDGGERLNRVYTDFYRGIHRGEVQLTFSKQSQNSSLAISEDKNIVYISTHFLDYKKAEVISGGDPNYDKKVNFYNLYKSIDGGKIFNEMPWNTAQSIEQIVFDKTGQRGYVIGGDRTLWRTSNEVGTWRKIKIPHVFKLIMPIDRGDKKSISYDWGAFYFDQNTKVLYLSCFVNDPVHVGKGKSIIYALPWDEDLVDMNKLEPIASVDNQFVTDIKVAGPNKFYLLTETYPFENYYTDMEHKTSHFIVLDHDKVTQYYEFGKKYMLGAFYIGKDNLFYITGMKEVGTGSYDDIAFISKNGGQDWREEKEGKWLQGNYFDPKTNKAWAYKQGKLYSRIIK